MRRRGVIAIGLGVLAALGAWAAFSASRLHPYAGNVGSSYELLFDKLAWLVVLAPFAGVLAASVTKRQDPRVEGERVLRHDAAAILAHWTHGVGTAALLASGLALGFLFVPRLLPDAEAAGFVYNLHFVAVVFFLFGTFYWTANTLLAAKRFREHLPTGNAVPYTVRHYGLLLGFKRYTMPPEDKYFESERMAFVMAVVATGLIIASGLVKVAAHFFDVPGSLMGVTNFTHDAATLLMLAFFCAHVFFAAIAPFSWPVLGSMFTGYVSLEHVKHEHAGWMARLAEEQRESENVVRLADDNAEPARAVSIEQ